MIEISSKNKAILQMLACSTLWSIAGIFIKLINCHALVIAGFRSLFAASTVYIFMRYKKTKFVITKKTALTAVFLTLTFLAFVSANKLTTAANAIVLQFTLPVFVLIFSFVFLKQKILLSDTVVVLCTMAGIRLVFLEGLDTGRFLGNTIGVLSGAFMAAYFILGSMGSPSEKMSAILLGHLYTAVVGLSGLLFTDNQLNLQSFSFLIILGVFQLGIPYILFGYATEHCPPLTCSLLSAAEPLLNPVWVAVFYNEKPGPIALAGCAVVLVSITAWCVYKGKKETQKVTGQT